MKKTAVGFAAITAAVLMSASAFAQDAGSRSTGPAGARTPSDVNSGTASPGQPTYPAGTGQVGNQGNGGGPGGGGSGGGGGAGGGGAGAGGGGAGAGGSGTGAGGGAGGGGSGGGSGGGGN